MEVILNNANDFINVSNYIDNNDDNFNMSDIAIFVIENCNTYTITKTHEYYYKLQGMVKYQDKRINLHNYE